MDIQTKTDIIHQKIYDFLLYIYPLLTKYPKYEKFSLQTATRNAILEMLQEVIKWDKTATKSHLYTVDTALQESKELLRLAHDLKYSAMNARHYGESCRKLKEIGVRRGKDQKIAGYGAAAYLQPLAALIAGGNWNNGANCGARAVNCNNYPWNVNTNIGARGACDLVRTLQAQSSTEYWQGLRKGIRPSVYYPIVRAAVPP